MTIAGLLQCSKIFLLHDVLQFKCAIPNRFSRGGRNEVTGLP